MKTYKQHRCEKGHRTYRTLANCMFPFRVWKSALGEGPFASVSWCNKRPGVPSYRYGVSVILYKTAEGAIHAKEVIDRTGCGGLCVKHHEVIRLELGGARKETS